jgi:hypothetical protein
MYKVLHLLHSAFDRVKLWVKFSAERSGFFVREEKVLRTFFILYWGSNTPPSLAGN